MASTATPKIVGKALYLELVANPENTEEENRSLNGWKSGGTRQIIVFPSSVDSTGKALPMAVMDRVVSDYSKRPQWETSYLGSTDKFYRNSRPKPFDLDNLPAPETDSYHSTEYFPIPQYSESEWGDLLDVERVASRKLALKLVLRDVLLGTMYVTDEADERVQVTKQSWQIRESKPIVVEVTDEDLSLVAEGTTPQAVIRRINKVRESLDNFPEKLVKSA